MTANSLTVTVSDGAPVPETTARSQLHELSEHEQLEVHELIEQERNKVADAGDSSVDLSDIEASVVSSYTYVHRAKSGLCGRDVSFDDPKLDSNPPDHLIVLVHGLMGGRGDWSNFVNEIVSSLKGHRFYIYTACCNEVLLGTYDGIDRGGERLFMEIDTVLTMLPSLNKISIIGHSLGGLYARFCIGRMYVCGLFSRVVPYNFITLATPHLGVRRPRSLAKGFGAALFNSTFSMVGSSFFGKTGKQLLLKDRYYFVEGRQGRNLGHKTASKLGDAVVQMPILRAMAAEHSPFHAGLELFRRRALYANIYHDFQVPYFTAAIVPSNPYRKNERSLKPSCAYPHITAASIETAFGQSPAAIVPATFAVGDKLQDVLTEMLSNLNQLAWCRFDVLFKTLVCHEQIIAKNACLRSKGEGGQDVAQHCATIFLI
eukprot:GILK01002807.1.p1 GENE.GILK01002807.1~~GILK01002807.1.p1  ORF type:complete len:430 (-),score=56.31 GILK01002807.1:273-1562(-)